MIKRNLQTEKHKNPNGYFIFRGILFKTKQGKINKQIQLIVPTSIAKALVGLLHQTAAFRHLDASRMEKAVSQYFHIVGITRICKEVVRNCTLCQLTKPLIKPKLTQGQKLTITRPRQCVCLDELKVLSGGEGKHEAHLIVFLDPFSLFTSVMQIKQDATAEDIMKCCLVLFAQQGLPSLVQLDNAKIHYGQMAQMMNALNIQTVNSAPLHPQSSPVERINRVLLQNLRILRLKRMLDRENLIFAAKFICHTWNASPIKSLQELTPFEIHFSTTSRNFIQTTTPQQTKNYRHFLKQVIGQRIILFNVLNSIRNNKETKRITPRNNESRIKVGDFVLLKREISQTKEDHKLRTRYYPHAFKVIKISSVKRNANNYILLPLEGQGLRRRLRGQGVINKSLLIWAKGDRLKLLHTNPDRLDNQLHVPMAKILQKALEQTKPQKEWTVDKRIINEKTTWDPEFRAMLQHFANPERPRIITRQYKELLADSEVGWLRDIYHPGTKDVSQIRQKSDKKSSTDSESDDNNVTMIDLLTQKRRASNQPEETKDNTIGEEEQSSTVQNFPQLDEELVPNVETDNQTPHIRRYTRLRQKPDRYMPKTPLRIRKQTKLQKRFPTQEGKDTEDHLDSEDSHIGEHENSEGHRGEHPDKIDTQEAN